MRELAFDYDDDSSDDYKGLSVSGVAAAVPGGLDLGIQAAAAPSGNQAFNVSNYQTSFYNPFGNGTQTQTGLSAVKPGNSASDIFASHFEKLQATITVSDNFFDNFKQTFARSFHPAVQNYLTQYDRYGWWCYFDEESKYGKGQAQNDFDANCRILALGYRCATIDAQDRGDDDCEEPWLTVYNPYKPWLPGTVEEQCLQLNPDSACAQDVCEIESNFSNNLFGYIMSEEDIDPDLLHQNLIFDPYLECNAGEYDFINAERACCGEYTTGRVPYRPDAEQQCCGSAVYNLNNQCCENAGDSIVLPLGTCQ